MEGRPDESELIEALRSGDEEAFAELVDELSPALLRLAMAHVPSRAVAEDVVADTWLAVFNGIDRFEGRSSLRTWIFQIMLEHRTHARQARAADAAVLVLRPARGGGARRAGGRPEPLQGRRGEQPGAWARPPVEWQAPEEKLESDETRRGAAEGDRRAPAAPARRDHAARHPRLLVGGGAKHPRPHRDQPASAPAPSALEGPCGAGGALRRDEHDQGHATDDLPASS